MVNELPPRSRAARDAAERALMRVAHHYGGTPEFVVLGGLVPELLCTGSEFRHAGTIDVDVQVGLEIACGAVNAARLEQALRNAGFAPEGATIWRWVADGTVCTPIVKFELLADLDDQPAEATIAFDACDQLGAVNLRGTGFAARDFEVRELKARDGDVTRTAEVKVSGLAGFLLAKTAAALSRLKPKDWYDIAFVLLHNDAGGTAAAAASARGRFSGKIAALRTAINDLQANFQGADAPRNAGIRHPDAHGPSGTRSRNAGCRRSHRRRGVLPGRAAFSQLSELPGRHTPVRPPLPCPCAHLPATLGMAP